MLLQSAISVTRFCKIPPLWQIFKIFGNLFKVYLVLGKVSNLLWHNLCAIGQIFITENGQILLICSHCPPLVSTKKLSWANFSSSSLALSRTWKEILKKSNWKKNCSSEPNFWNFFSKTFFCFSKKVFFRRSCWMMMMMRRKRHSPEWICSR